MERLIAAQEAQTNAITRLIQVLERRHTKPQKGGRARRVIPANDAPMVVTPLVEAKVKRALARLGAGK